MHQYQTEDFLYEALPDPIDIAIDKKVNLLYDLCILRKTKKDRKMLADEREAALREVLSEYTNEKQLDNALLQMKSLPFQRMELITSPKTNGTELLLTSFERVTLTSTKRK